MAPDCMACNTLTGRLLPPGGKIFEDEYWVVEHVLPPILTRGLLVIKTRRHCEHLAELTPAEAATLGPLIRRVCRAMMAVLSPEKVYVSSYGEGVRHVHFMVTPRLASMPASNIWLTYLLVVRRILYRLGMKWLAYSENEAALLADRIRAAMLVDSGP